MKQWLVLAVLTAVSSAWAINKCPLPNGRVQYQEQPCDGGEKLKLSAAPPSSNGGIPDPMYLAVLHRRPFVGMTEAQLLRVMGRPTRVNTGDYGADTDDQLIFEKPDLTWYVYTHNGIVRSIQSSQAPMQVAHPVHSEPRPWCPSGLTLRNMETSASSRTLGDVERARRLQEIKEIRERCN